MVRRGVARDVIVNLWHTNQGGPGPHWIPIWSRGRSLPTWCRNKISALKEGMLPILVLFKTFKVHSGWNRKHWRISSSSDWGKGGRFCHRCFLYFHSGSHMAISNISLISILETSTQRSCGSSLIYHHFKELKFLLAFWREREATGWLGSNENETRVALEYWSTIVSPSVHRFIWLLHAPTTTHRIWIHVEGRW